MYFFSTKISLLMEYCWIEQNLPSVKQINKLISYDTITLTPNFSVDAFRMFTSFAVFLDEDGVSIKNGVE